MGDNADKYPYAFDDIRKYFEQTSEYSPSLSEFVRENINLVVRSPPRGTNFNSLDGAWKKRFRTTAVILNVKEINVDTPDWNNIIEMRHEEKCLASHQQDEESNNLQKELSPEIFDYVYNENIVFNDRFQTPLHQIVSNTYDSEVSINENILRISAMNLAKPDESKETTESGSIKNISDWICTTEELGVAKEEDHKELIKIKKYLNQVMLPLAPNSSEYHYWSEFGHHFFSRQLQEFIGLDWRVLEVPVQASKYRKNYGHNHAIDKIQARPPTKSDLTKLTMDSFKLYREMRDCLNVRILQAMGKEYGSLNIASNPAQMSEMKSGILRLLEFMMIIKNKMENNVETEYNVESVQILKRKFDEIIPTRPSPSKIAKK
nr:2008_t:CDS:10 [Entrophospora candida]